MTELTFDNVLQAHARVANVLPETPAWNYPVLDASVGARVVVKHENAQPTGAFKVRGGVNLLASLSAEERAAGLVTVSTGNHAQSIAWASARAGVAATIVMPESAPSNKVDAVRALGAQAVISGATMTEAAAVAESMAAADGLRLVNPGNEPAIILGHATVYLELLRAHPEIETLYVPVGSGSGAAGAVLVRDGLGLPTRVVAVQAAGAPAGYLSWRSGRLETAGVETFASGLATGVGFAATQAVLANGLDDFLLVTDDELRAAMALMAASAHTLCEGAGAAGLAATLADAARPGVVGFACTGGNASREEVAEIARLGLAA